MDKRMLIKFGSGEFYGKLSSLFYVGSVLTAVLHAVLFLRAFLTHRLLITAKDISGRSARKAKIRFNVCRSFL